MGPTWAKYSIIWKDKLSMGTGMIGLYTLGNKDIEINLFDTFRLSQSGLVKTIDK